MEVAHPQQSLLLRTALLTPDSETGNGVGNLHATWRCFASRQNRRGKLLAVLKLEMLSESQGQARSVQST